MCEGKKQTTKLVESIFPTDKDIKCTEWGCKANASEKIVWSV